MPVAGIDVVVAAAAVEQIGRGRGVELVVVGAAPQVLDAVEAVAVRAAADREIDIHVDGHRGEGVAVAHGVDAAAAEIAVGAVAALEIVVAVAARHPVVAGAAVESVVAAVAPHGVVAGTAIDAVGGVVALQGIAVARAVEVLDAAQMIAGGVAAGRGAEEQVDADTGVGAAVGGGVDAGAADDRVALGTTDNDVVAGATVELVLQGAAIDRVVAAIAEDRVDRRGADQDMALIVIVDNSHRIFPWN